MKAFLRLFAASLGVSLMVCGQAAKPAVQTPSMTRGQAAKNAAKQLYSPEQIAAGQELFAQKCAFCHGRDAGGGETGPDLTDSKLVAQDVKGNLIAGVVREGRPDKGMPRFNLSASELAGVVAFIHDQKAKVDSHEGRRRGVDAADLRTGDAAAGKQYFNNAGGCSGCHSPTGDLARVASRFHGLQLEERLLYPDDAVAHATVTLPSGEVISGVLEYRDEFTIGVRDAAGWYRSWPVASVKFKIDDPAQAHANLLAKYSDENIHDLMAYLQTLK